MEPLPAQRLARPSDAPRIAELMRASVQEIFPRFYDARQTASAAVHMAALDMHLVEDGTYFVHEHDGEIVACGGWSKRNKLASGEGAADDDDRLLDPGFQEMERFELMTPDGVALPCVFMQRPIA